MSNKPCVCCSVAVQSLNTVSLSIEDVVEKSCDNNFPVVLNDNRKNVGGVTGPADRDDGWGEPGV